MSASINEKERIVNVVFLFEIAEKHQRESFILDWKHLNEEEFVRRRIDSSVQPDSVCVDLTRRLIDGNAIRACTVNWL